MSGNTRGTDAPSLTHKTLVLLSTLYKELVKRLNLIFWIPPSCETSNAQTHTEIRSLPKAGHCIDAFAFDSSVNRRRELSAFTMW